MIRSSIHNHTTLCDGTNNPRDMINAAIAAGFTDFGISAHSYAPFDLQYSIKSEDDYIDTMRELKQYYKDKINLYTGLEQDFFAVTNRCTEYDYIIGSVHYIKGCDDKYYAVDAGKDKFKQCVQDFFGGDAMALVREYYRLTAENITINKPDIIGHFDLVVKNNAQGDCFDEQSTEYKKTALTAAQAALSMGAIFEVNTGGMARGYKNTPYPARFILEYLSENKASVTINSDAHSISALRFGIDDAIELLRSVGFKSTKQLLGGGWREVAF